MKSPCHSQDHPPTGPYSVHQDCHHCKPECGIRFWVEDRMTTRMAGRSNKKINDEEIPKWLELVKNSADAAFSSSASITRSKRHADALRTSERVQALDSAAQPMGGVQVY